MKTAKEMKALADDPESKANALRKLLEEIDKEIEAHAKEGLYFSIPRIGHHLLQEVIANLISRGFKVYEYSPDGGSRRVSWS